LRPRLLRLLADPYLLLIVSMVALASVLPARGAVAPVFDGVTRVAIGLVFFLHGARLSRQAVVRGLTHWRLHLLVLVATFGLFPLLGLGIAALPAAVTPPALAAGIIFLCCLPATIQSSIGFVSIARGDVASAVASATASNLLGVFLTPALVALTLHAQGGGVSGGGVSGAAVQAIVLQLLIPFLAGQLLRPWIGDWVAAQARTLSFADRGSILLVVYTAFSHAVLSGVWREVGVLDVARLFFLCCALLAVVLTVTGTLARLFSFSKEDEIVIVFCGSKKSLASGVPMAAVLFAPALAGQMLLPVLLFHQIQLMTCAVIAQRYARRLQVEGNTL
jgi:sodium/bile acid cotransporter 7